MGKYIAVAGCELAFFDATYLGTKTITTLPSTNMTVDKKGVYAGQLTISLASFTDSNKTITGGAGTGFLNPGSTKVKNNGNFVALEDDISEMITVTGVSPQDGKTPVTIAVQVKIKSAGQNKVRAE